MPTLVYRISPLNGGVVFAYESDAERIAQVHHALKTARTWADFRARMPAAEYSRVVQGFDNAQVRRPKSNAAFSPDDVSGWSDGDYPDWLQQDMDCVVPEDLLSKYGRLAHTLLNGAFWMIAAEHAKPLADELRVRGYRVIRRQSLRFW